MMLLMGDVIGVTLVFLGLGSNTGDREAFIEKTASAIANLGNSTVQQSSSVYETQPWGKEDQDPFLNQVLELETELLPDALLKACQKIECALGRKRGKQWGPRTIDIDILLYGEWIIETDTLCIPHPRMWERRFVLVPLSEIASSVSVPGCGKTVIELLGRCPDKGYVKLHR